MLLVSLGQITRQRLMQVSYPDVLVLGEHEVISRSGTQTLLEHRESGGVLVVYLPEPGSELAAGGIGIARSQFDAPRFRNGGAVQRLRAEDHEVEQGAVWIVAKRQ